MKRWLLTAVSFAVVIGVSVYAVRSGAPHGVDLSIPPQAHALALLAFLFEVVARSWKLSWSARAVGSRLPVTTAMRTSLGGDFGAAITPARMGAEPARFLILAEAGVTGKDALMILYAELFFEMVSLAIVAGATFWLFDASGPAEVAMVSVVGAYALLVVGIGVLAVLVSRRAPSEEPPRWARRLLHGRRWEIIRRALVRTRDSVHAFRDLHVGWALLSLLASVAHIAVRFTILPAIIYSSTRAAIPLAPLVVWPLGIFYGASVVPAPGGGGAVELAFRAALGPVIPAALFASALVWWRFYTFYLYIALGALVAGNTALRAVREAEEIEEELEKPA